jgi:hypothetical protein
MAIGVRKFRVEGISSLLMNSPHGMARGGSAKLDTKKIPSPEDEAASKVYKQDDGTLFLPSISFRSSLLKGCTGRRIGKVGAATRVAAGVFNVETETPLFDPESGEPIKDYRVHVTRCVVQRNGVMRARPEIPRWAAEVVFEVDDDFVTVEQVKELLGIAGRIAGVGDWRPEKKGPYGRFKVL